MPVTLLDFKKKIYKQLGIYDASLPPKYTDDEDILARINDVIDKAVKFAFMGKSIPKTWGIVHGKPVNMITCQDEVYSHTDEDISFAVSKAYSYYFELDDAATVTISQEGTVLKTITIDPQPGDRAFTAYKGSIPGANGCPITITFSGNYYYNIQNVALYGAQFPSDDRIPAFNIWVPHVIPANLYQVKRATLQDGSGVEYRISERNLLIRYDTEGQITVESAYFPDTIVTGDTAAGTTADNTVIDVPTENESIIIDKACELLTHKAQGYQDYVNDVDQGMQMLDQRPSSANARVVRLIDI